MDLRIIVVMHTQQLPSGVTLVPLPAFTDNYIWCFYDSTSCVVVDPGDANVVETFCRQQSLTLSAILITHHHADHTAGLPKLIRSFPDVKVYGPNNPSISLINSRVSEGDLISIESLALEFSVIEIPGHTLDHIGFIGHGGILCGDTLFSAGCGRLFEGTPTQMLTSLAKLTNLDDTTNVWCTHEYTLANLAFAQAVEPLNEDLQQYTRWAKDMRNQNIPTLPTNIKTQKAINPFLRAHTPSVKCAAEEFAQVALAGELEVFTTVRSWKDNF